MLPPFATRSTQADQPGTGRRLACSDARYPTARVPYSSAGTGSEQKPQCLICYLYNFGSLPAMQPVWPGQCEMNP